MNEDLLLIKRLEAMRALHQELDRKLDEEHLDDFTRQRMKKERLNVRQKMVELEHIVYPDIIA